MKKGIKMKRKTVLFLVIMLVLALVVSGCTTSSNRQNNENTLVQALQSPVQNSTPALNVVTTKETNISGTGGEKILVAYFSHSGNTRVIANQIHDRVGGDIFEIKTVDTYPQDYEAVKAVAMKELNEGSRPSLATHVDNMDSYDVVFVGYPIWWGTMPTPVESFLTGYNLSGKTIVPFSTHEGSGLGSSVRDIKALCPQSTVREGLAIRGGSVNTAQDQVTSWLQGMGYTGNGTWS
jgi:flavodoxin